MIGILLNLRTVTEENSVLLEQLKELVTGTFTENLTLQVNVTQNYDDKIFDILPKGDWRIKVTLNDFASSKATNGMLRGRYAELDRHYVWFIDDDFRITDTKHLAKVLSYINEYMNDHPTCQIAKLAFNSPKNENIEFRFPIESTSLCCGLIIRTMNYPIFTPEQMRWNWKTDDFTMVLNALDKGYGIDVHGHGVVHNIKTKPEEVEFKWEDIYPVAKELGYEEADLAHTDSGKISYVNRNQKCGLRYVLQKELNSLSGKNLIPIDGPKVSIVSTSPSSILMENELLFNNAHSRINYLSRKDYTDKANIVTNQIRALDLLCNADVLIISAGHLNRPNYDCGPLEYFDPNEENTLEWNLKYLDKYLENRSKGVIIFMGSVAADLGYPTQPLYAGEKSFYRNLCKSLRKRYKSVVGSNFNFYYLTIPATKSKMCDHGFNSKIIAEHIALLCGFKQEQFTIHSKNLSYLND